MLFVAKTDETGTFQAPVGSWNIVAVKEGHVRFGTRQDQSVSFINGSITQLETELVPLDEVHEQDLNEGCQTSDGNSDYDGDGYNGIGSGGNDCDDNNASIYPGAPEVPDDGIDQDCDGKDTVSEHKQYHVLKRSGAGYRKMWGGFAEYRTGYDYFYAYALPSEVSSIIDTWDNFDDATANACESTSPAICPCPPYPDIWTQGSIELVGSFDTIEELDSYRCDTPSYMPYYFICDQWSVDSDPKYWDNINSICGG
jgi:hypothetical protein